MTDKIKLYADIAAGVLLVSAFIWLSTQALVYGLDSMSFAWTFVSAVGFLFAAAVIEDELNCYQEEAS